MKRIVILTAAVLLLLTSCGQTAAAVEEENKESESYSEAAAEENSLKPVLPNTTYSGAEFRISHNDYSTNNYDLIADEMNGELLNDIIYKRNLDTEELFDIKIRIILENGDIYNDNAIKIVSAGEDAYDLITTDCHRLVKIMSLNIVYDLNEAMPYIDFTKPWWNSNFRDNMMMNGKLFFAVGDFSHIILESLQSLTFNINLFKEQGLTMPYESVRNGAWTFDKLQTLAAEFTRDLNGDGKINYDDQYGYFGHEWIVTSDFMYSNDTQICSFENGLPYIDLNEEKIENVWEAYTNLVSTAGILPSMEDFNNYGLKMFQENRLLFRDSTMREVRFSLRDMESDFGLVPFPKFREEIEYYRSFVGGEANVFSVPITTSQTEMISAVMEYMAYYGYENITPVYYDTILGWKLMRDQDSRDMLDILRKSMFFDFGVWSGLPSGQLVGHDLLKNGKNPASYLAANRTKMENELHDLLLSVGAVEE